MSFYLLIYLVGLKLLVEIKSSSSNPNPLFQTVCNNRIVRSVPSDTGIEIRHLFSQRTYSCCEDTFVLLIVTLRCGNVQFRLAHSSCRFSNNSHDQRTTKRKLSCKLQSKFLSMSIQRFIDSFSLTVDE